MDVVVPNHDAELFTTIYPNSGKETIILLHGGPGVPDGLTFIATYLSRHYQVIHFHQRGTLKSQCFSHNYSPEQYCADINTIADYFGVPKFHLFGHSWGGLYAQIYAQHNQHRLLSLFLCSPGSGTGYQWKDTMLEVAKYTKNKCRLYEWLTMNIYSVLGLLGSNKAYKKFYRQALICFNRGFREDPPEHFRINCIRAQAINQTTKAILSAPILPDLASPAFRITIAYGDDDIFGASKKYVIQRYPSANVLFVPESGHMPWSHNRKVFVPILNAHYGL